MPISKEMNSMNSSPRNMLTKNLCLIWQRWNRHTQTEHGKHLQKMERLIIPWFQITLTTAVI